MNDGPPANPAQPASPDYEAARERLLAAKAADREQVLREIVRSNAADVLKTAIDDNSDFLKNGLNSLTALELTKTLMNITGLEISMVAIVDYPTPATLSHYLAEELVNAPVS